VLKGDQHLVSNSTAAAAMSGVTIWAHEVMTDAWTSHENSPQSVRVLGAEDDANRNRMIALTVPTRGGLFGIAGNQTTPPKLADRARAEDLFAPASAALSKIITEACLRHVLNYPYGIGI
jgi:hypothetical protein